MLKNIFITGTDSKLIVNMGKNSELAEKSFFHAVSNTTDLSAHVTNFSAFSAPLICSYARSNLTYIDKIIICLKIPSLPSFEEEDKHKDIEKYFHTEWYFIIDLIRQALSLFDKVAPKDMLNHKGKLIIVFPLASKHNLNNTQFVYYNCLDTALRTMIKKLPHHHQKALLYRKYDSSGVASLLQQISTIIEKNIDTKIFFEENIFLRIKKKIMDQFRL